MRYQCTPSTDLHELIGQDSAEGFNYGPLSAALMNSEELILVGSHILPRTLIVKINAVLGGLFIVETEETLRAQPGFKLVLH